ncbi:uncharacterized protein LOC135335257 [Halichondria panicea]|uniref:uncharacterized protein LOC135335257 n=1 Tax=Halichondria panicea TaxID=6063 RepID=UPI00312B34C4
MDLLKSVKRVLSIQELRQAEYNKLRSVHGNYTSHTVSLSDYQKAMAEITTAFQSLSRETIQLSAVIRDHSLPQAAQVLDRIQAVEKVKLTLTAEWQVLVAVEIGDEEFDQAEHTHKQKILRQKLARVEGEIAELVQDFRYECEHILVSAMDHIS